MSTPPITSHSRIENIQIAGHHVVIGESTVVSFTVL